MHGKNLNESKEKSEFGSTNHDFKCKVLKDTDEVINRKQTTSNSVFLWVKDFISQSTANSWLKF